jgi:CBS domain containing-hemolysin-like protein
VIERLGRLPDVGETLEFDGYELEVIELGDALIEKMRVHRRGAAARSTR